VLSGVCRWRLRLTGVLASGSSWQTAPRVAKASLPLPLRLSRRPPAERGRSGRIALVNRERQVL